MDKVTFFHRHKSKGYSIQKIFSTIVEKIKENRAVDNFYLPCYKADPISLLKNLLYTFKHRNKKGINHISGDIHYCILALVGCKSILTIHDLVFIKNSKNKFDRFLKLLLWLYLPVKLADKVVCISKHTKQEVLKYIKVKNISVIYNPIDSAFEYAPKQFNSLQPVILQIGTGWNKNLNRVIEALENIPCHLRIIGKLSNKHIALLDEKQISYSNAYSLSDKDIVEEYQNCDIVSFLSIYEGFGMPVIEGQATGRVIVTSNIQPIIEISGNSTVLVNPFDVTDIKKGILYVISNNGCHEDLIFRGLNNVKRFQPQTIANQYIMLYDNLTNQ